MSAPTLEQLGDYEWWKKNAWKSSGGRLMQNEILNQRIPRLLKNDHPLAGGQIAIILSADPKEVRHALYDLMDAGKVAQSLDGYRYELASGGYCPDPEPKGAA